MYSAHYLLNLNFVIIEYIFESIKGTHTHTLIRTHWLSELSWVVQY